MPIHGSFHTTLAVDKGTECFYLLELLGLVVDGQRELETLNVVSWKIFSGILLRLFSDVLQGALANPHEIERKIYERLGNHPNLLAFLGERILELDGSLRRGLCFSYEPRGILRDVLLDPGAKEALGGVEREWPYQLLQAVGYIHSKQVIHGDIGTHNILLGRGGRPLLCDFGGSRIDNGPCSAFPSARYRRLAIPIEEQTAYAPNEQDDLFALGMDMFEILSGSNPWVDLGHPEILDRIRAGAWPVWDAEGVEERERMRIIRNCWDSVYRTADEVQMDWNRKIESEASLQKLGPMLYLPYMSR
ncbi:kinase-like domain-containing protein [Chaetomidium leptoderma]|uniref:Kinase-like domain-containing protein n=1 Tax=Chaetomidium leptoderma TaxID=669021 RepID=A0AAN6VM87_9PEZI|nr:kinase-like domain-containing protein [Chaetomidium leptoderma]